MDKKLLDALAAKAEQRAKDRKNAKQFEVAGEMLTFVQPSVDAKLSYAEAICPRVRQTRYAPAQA